MYDIVGVQPQLIKVSLHTPVYRSFLQDSLQEVHTNICIIKPGAWEIHNNQNNQTSNLRDQLIPKRGDQRATLSLFVNYVVTYVLNWVFWKGSHLGSICYSWSSPWERLLFQRHRPFEINSLSVLSRIANSPSPYEGRGFNLNGVH